MRRLPFLDTPEAKQMIQLGTFGLTLQSKELEIVAGGMCNVVIRRVVLPDLLKHAFECVGVAEGIAPKDLPDLWLRKVEKPTRKLEGLAESQITIINCAAKYVTPPGTRIEFDEDFVSMMTWEEFLAVQLHEFSHHLDFRDQTYRAQDRYADLYQDRFERKADDMRFTREDKETRTPYLRAGHFNRNSERRADQLAASYGLAEAFARCVPKFRAFHESRWEWVEKPERPKNPHAYYLAYSHPWDVERLHVMGKDGGYKAFEQLLQTSSADASVHRVLLDAELGTLQDRPIHAQRQSAEAKALSKNISTLPKPWTVQVDEANITERDGIARAEIRAGALYRLHLLTCDYVQKKMGTAIRQVTPSRLVLQEVPKSHYHEKTDEIRISLTELTVLQERERETLLLYFIRLAFEHQLHDKATEESWGPSHVMAWKRAQAEHTLKRITTLTGIDEGLILDSAADGPYYQQGIGRKLDYDYKAQILTARSDFQTALLVGKSTYCGMLKKLAETHSSTDILERLERIETLFSHGSDRSR